MQIKSKGISEAVLEVKNMSLAVEFWHDKLGFPIVDGDIIMGNSVIVRKRYGLHGYMLAETLG